MDELVPGDVDDDGVFEHGGDDGWAFFEADNT